MTTPLTIDVAEPTETQIQQGIRMLQSVAGYAVIFDGHEWLEMKNPKAAIEHAKAQGWKQAWLLQPSNLKG